MIRTQEQLKLWFQLEKEKRLKQQQKQKERIKQIKAQEKERKLKHKQHLAKLEKEAQNYWKQPQIEFSRIITIYNSRYIERFIGEDDLYTTREELENAEPNNINWRLWDSIVNKTRKELNIK